MFHKMVKMNIVGTFVTLGLQLDKHIVRICSNTHFIMQSVTSTWLHITVRFILGYVVRRLVIIIIIITIFIGLSYVLCYTKKLAFINPVKTVLQDLARKGPFFLHPCKILRNLAISCGILQDSCTKFLQDSCKIPQDLARYCKIL